MGLLVRVLHAVLAWPCYAVALFCWLIAGREAAGFGVMAASPFSVQLFVGGLFTVLALIFAGLGRLILGRWPWRRRPRRAEDWLHQPR